MTSAAERLSALKEKLKVAREDNLQAVKDEGKRRVVVINDSNNRDIEYTRQHEREHLSGHQKESKSRKRARTSDSAIEIDSADEAEGENEDGRMRSMKRRARRLKLQNGGEEREGDADGVVEYGKTGHDVSAEDVERMREELRETEKRREKLWRRRAFDEERSDINFINEENRLFNRKLDKHFDKFESVKKIKDSLERGTA